MNKKLKIVSSIALAGMLVTRSLGMSRALAAETPDYETNPVAIYRKLVEGKTVVPFVLANKDDVVTVKEVVENDLFAGKVVTFNGTAIPALDTVVGTGDKFTTVDGTEYTVIVYGDVDGDGKVGVLDALQVEKNNVNMISLLSNKVKLKIIDNINKLMPEKYSSIFLGLILGDTKNIEESIQNSFKIANISHVLAISGMHITYIILGVELILKKILG